MHAGSPRGGAPGVRHSDAALGPNGGERPAIEAPNRRPGGGWLHFFSTGDHKWKASGHGGAGPLEFVPMNPHPAQPHPNSPFDSGRWGPRPNRLDLPCSPDVACRPPIVGENRR